MKCPACFNDLTEIQVGSLKVDVCQGGCGGIWFDAFELQKADEEEEVAGGNFLDIQRDEGGEMEPKRKSDCSRGAGGKMKRQFFNAQRRLEEGESPEFARE